MGITMINYFTKVLKKIEKSKCIKQEKDDDAI